MTLLKFSAAALALLPVSAFAEDDIVVTASGFEQPRSETGQAISVVDAERLAELQSVSISDALRTLPGIAVAARGDDAAQHH